MDNKVIAGIVGLAVLVVGVSFLDKPAQVTVNVPENPVSVTNNVPEGQFGARPGFEEYSPFEANNGVTRWPLKQSFRNATGTVAAVRSPNASSTLQLAISVQVATGTASIIEVATSTNTFATSTQGGLLGSFSLASGAKGTFVATSTNIGCSIGTTACEIFKFESNGAGTSTAARISDLVIPPNTWVVVKVGAEYGSANIRGNTVQTIFTEI